jgi:hypothetical protein
MISLVKGRPVKPVRVRLPCEHRNGEMCLLDPVPLGCWTFEAWLPDHLRCPAIAPVTDEERRKYETY